MLIGQVQLQIEGFTLGYCTMLGGNLVTWRSKKQPIVARSSTEDEFRAMAHGMCELLWLIIIPEDLRVKWYGTMKLYCDKKSIISIAHNPVQHDQTKHVKVDRRFIKEKLDSGLICTLHVSTDKRLADILTKGLTNPMFQTITSKLGMEDIYHPACGGVLENPKFILKIYQICINRHIQLSSLFLVGF